MLTGAGAKTRSAAYHKLKGFNCSFEYLIVREVGVHAAGPKEKQP
jgi:hypothetical protein